MSLLSLTVLAGLALAAAAPPQANQRDSVAEAAAAFQQGRAQQAEQTLRAALRRHPNDPRALSLLGVVLDSRRAFDEAERCYLQALAAAPGSAALLNNLGNHYLARGRAGAARESFLKVLAADPAHPNANLQLARLAVESGKGAAALPYLARLPADQQTLPAVAVLKAEALYAAGRTAEADAAVAGLSEESNGDPRFAFTLGLALARAGQFAQAETAFSRALEAQPADFDVLYNLGLAASRAGHLERARDVLAAALRQQPDDVEALSSLAAVHARLNEYENAVLLLVKARKLAPARADLLLFLAHATESLGYYGDAALVYNDYLKLKPQDDVARRERGFALARSSRLQDGLADLEWYARRHPKDATGLFELGVVKIVDDPNQALVYLEKALALEPDSVSTRYARGTVYYQQGDAGRALPDLQFAAARDPRNVRVLDRLGQALITLDRPAEAVPYLRRAADLAPRDSKILMHLSRALADSGNLAESRQVLARFREVGPDQARRLPFAGLLDFLSLSPAEQRARFVSNAQRLAAADPGNIDLKLRLGKLLYEDGRRADAAQVFRDIQALHPDSRQLAAAGATLLSAGEYDAAREFLDRIPAAGATAETRLNAAIAAFRASGAVAGLDRLDRLPDAERGGDYYLARAQVLDAAGKFDDAVAALNRAFRAAPTRPDLYLEAVEFLLKNSRDREALDLLTQATRLLPDDRDLLLSHAVVLELNRQSDEAERLLNRLENRWPEWDRPYLVHGILLEIHVRSPEARQHLETALALGSRAPEAYYYLAQSTMRAAPDELDTVSKALAQALALAPGDPWAHALAGRVAFEKSDYPAAVAQLLEAIRLRPRLVQAHYNLSQVYSAMGRKQDSAAELDLVRQIRAEHPGAEEEPTAIRSLLFR